MSRTPKPDVSARKSWRPEPAPADYHDEVSDTNFETLKKISKKEVDEKDFVVVDGPAW